LAGETEVLGENLPQRHFCPSQNDQTRVWTLGRRNGKPATNRLSYGAAQHSSIHSGQKYLKFNQSYTNILKSPI
jgi:hypothetical protein